MLKMMVFAITLVVSNVASVLILWKVMMSKRFLKKYMHTVQDLTKEVLEEVDF